MRKIKLQSFQSTSLNPLFSKVDEIEIETKAFSSGAFGEVHKCSIVNGKQLSPKDIQVVKIFKDDGNGSAKRGYDTIKELQNEIKTYNHQLKRNNKKTIEQMNGFGALPQFSYKFININGDVCYGYSANLLHSNDWILFDDIFNGKDKDTLRNQFYKTNEKLRLQMAYDLVEAFYHLEKIKFIYADLNPKNFFVDIKKGALCLIDYEGGGFGSTETFGKLGEWLSPEIEIQRKLGKTPSGDHNSDAWAVFVGVHFMLYNFHPLFYLSVRGEVEMRNYFGKNKWPNISTKDSNYNQKNDKVYKKYEKSIKNIPEKIYEAFEKIINKGYFNISERLTCEQWLEVLSPKPLIKEFKSSWYIKNRKTYIEFIWDVQNAERVYINGYEVKGTSAKIEATKEKESYILTAEKGSEIVQEIKEVRISKPKVELSTNKIIVKDGVCYTDLIWMADHFYTLTINNNIGDVTEISSKRHRVILKQSSTEFKIKAVGGFYTAEDSIIVTRPDLIINGINYSLRYQNNDIFLNIQWNIANAKNIIIKGNSIHPSINSHEEKIIKSDFNDKGEINIDFKIEDLFNQETIKPIQIKIPPINIKKNTHKFLFEENKTYIEFDLDIENTDNVKISGIQVKNKGTQRIEVDKLNSSTHYELVASSIFEIIRKEVVFNAPCPIISNFSNEYKTDGKLLLAILKWDVENVKSIMLSADNGYSGSVFGKSEIILPLTAKLTTYKLDAIGAFDTVSSNIILESPALRINTFDYKLHYNNKQIFAEFDIDIEGASFIVINNGVGKVVSPKPKKSIILKEKESIYEITAIGFFSEKIKKQIKVSVPSPVVKNFGAYIGDSKIDDEVEGRQEILFKFDTYNAHTVMFIETSGSYIKEIDVTGKTVCKIIQVYENVSYSIKAIGNFETYITTELNIRRV